MILYLLRHGQAHPKTSAIADEDLALTPIGRAKLEKMLTLSKNSLGVEIDRILSSPYRRAQESAEIAKEILKPKKPKIITDESITSEKSPYEVYAFVSKQGFGPQDRVLIVSHQPMLSEVISDLIGTGTSISLAPGSMARIDVDGEPNANSGTLVWLISSNVIFV